MYIKDYAPFSMGIASQRSGLRMYKLFLVEDEIVTREGMRDSVDWGEAGFQFVGDASDGEAALPSILEVRPDIVITDIKMPFMDGLELTRILKEQLPETKVIILSGHDEFEFAQKAIPLEVSEYLLKPITPEELVSALQRVAEQLDSERREQDYLLDLVAKSHAHQELLQEKLLLRLVTGGIDTSDAVEQSQRLHLNILASQYLVMLLRFEGKCGSFPVDYMQYQNLREGAVNAVKKNPDVLWVYKDLDELVLIIKGAFHSPLNQEAQFISHLIRKTLPLDSDCVIEIGVGSKCDRLTNLNESYAAAEQALMRGSDVAKGSLAVHTDFLILSKESIERFLHISSMNDFDSFFDETIVPLQEALENSQVYRNYVFTHVVFTCVHFVKQLGGNAYQVVRELDSLDERLAELTGLDDFKVRLFECFSAVLNFRDAQVLNLHSSLVWEAKAYLRDNFHKPEVSLQTVAEHVSMSPSHFSRVFSQEAGQTFVEFLTSLRIDRAKELLCTTNLRAYQIAEEVGYNDPHYFSTVFKRITAFSPSEYRDRRKTGSTD